MQVLLPGTGCTRLFIFYVFGALTVMTVAAAEAAAHPSVLYTGAE